MVSLFVNPKKFVVAATISFETAREYTVFFEERLVRNQVVTVREVTLFVGNGQHGERVFLPEKLLFKTAEGYEAVADAAKVAFFQGTDKYVDSLAARVKADAAKWKLDSDILAPYIAIINAAMMGKSRMQMNSPTRPASARTTKWLPSCSR